MPDTRQHRGPHPEDAELFAESRWPTLRDATADLSWLLSRGYGEIASLKLVGDRFNLATRQRSAARRGACTDAQLAHRLATRVDDARGRAVWIDGYNVLTTVEVALGGGVVLACRDGCYRDIAGVHGTYRRVEETLPAIALLAATLTQLGVGTVTWVLDAPVSNSGRLAAILRETPAWQVELAADADKRLRDAPFGTLVASADGIVLDRCAAWLNLAAIACAGVVGCSPVALA